MDVDDIDVQGTDAPTPGNLDKRLAQLDLGPTVRALQIWRQRFTLYQHKQTVIGRASRPVIVDGKTEDEIFYLVAPCKAESLTRKKVEQAVWVRSFSIDRSEDALFFDDQTEGLCRTGPRPYAVTWEEASLGVAMGLFGGCARIYPQGFTLFTPIRCDDLADLFARRLAMASDEPFSQIRLQIADTDTDIATCISTRTKTPSTRQMAKLRATDDRQPLAPMSINEIPQTPPFSRLTENEATIGNTVGKAMVVDHTKQDEVEVAVYWLSKEPHGPRFIWSMLRVNTEREHAGELAEGTWLVALAEESEWQVLINQDQR